MVHRVYGRKYQIKQQRGRYYIQTADGQLTVTHAIKDYVEPDCVFNYIFEGGAQSHPCPAMDYWIMRWRLKTKISIGDFKLKHKNCFKIFAPKNVS